MGSNSLEREMHINRVFRKSLLSASSIQTLTLRASTPHYFGTISQCKAHNNPQKGKEMDMGAMSEQRIMVSNSLNPGEMVPGL